MKRVILTIALLLSLGLVTQANADVNTGPQYGDFQDVLTDTNGNVVSVTSGEVNGTQGIASPYGSADTTNAGTPTILDPGTSAPTPSQVQTAITSNVFMSTLTGASSTPTPGCMTHYQDAKEMDVINVSVQFIYRMTAYWCWDNAWHITSWNNGPVSWPKVAYGWKVDENCVGKDSTSCYGWYYSWHGSPTGGHYAFRQGRIEQDIPLIGVVIGYCYPKLQLWVNAGPYWSGTHSDGC